MPLQIERQYGASLDANYSFSTLDELKNYATTSALSYSGQILYCKENDTLYKVNNDKTDVGTLGGGGEEVDLTEYIKEADADEKYVLDEDIEVIDSATIESMLNLSDEELTNLSTMFQDAEVRIDRGWSSSKIYSELNTTLDIAKAYTLSELSKAISASYKVVTSVDQMTDSKVLYLLKDADSGMYNIYVFDEDTTSAELIGSFEINLDDFYTKTESEDLFATKADVVANYATKQEVVDSYATKTELQDAIADVEVEISETENNQIQTLEDGLFVDSETVTISKADYDALSVEEKSNGKTYFVPDDETTEDGTDLTQFAKVSDLEDGTITVGNSKKLNGLTKDELFAETNNKIKEINNNLAQLIKTTTVTASADMAANSYAFISVSVPETPSGYRRLFVFIQGGSGSIDTSQLLIGSGTTGCRVYNNLPQKQTVTIECRIVYIKNC